MRSETIEVRECNDPRVIPLIDQHAREMGVRCASLADVGSSDRPAIHWFRKWQLAIAPHGYTAIDLDEEKLTNLRGDGLVAVNSFEKVGGPHDLTLATEVIEHVRAEDSVEFLSNCEKITGKLFGLTTPNFEYWKGFRAVNDYRECRWIPDHALDFKPGSPNPHSHQQEMTPGSLTSYMMQAFPSPKWTVYVYRAWPWLLRDLARETEFKLYFKLFAVARREDCIDGEAQRDAPSPPI